MPETKGRDPSDIADMLKYGLRSQINVSPMSPLGTRHRNASVCSPDAVSISSRHRRISDIKNPDSLVLEIQSPLSPAEMFPSSTVVGSPAAVVHHNNSYTNLPAIPEQPGKNPTSEPIPNDSTSPMSMPHMMPSIPENLAGVSTRLEEVLNPVISNEIEQDSINFQSNSSS